MMERSTAQAILQTGKIFVFDDVGCLVNWLAQQPEAPASTWVWSAAGTGGWLAADSAVYLRSDSLRTPMGSHLAALPAGAAADSLQRTLGAERLTWDEVRGAGHQHRAAP